MPRKIDFINNFKSDIEILIFYRQPQVVCERVLLPPNGRVGNYSARNSNSKKAKTIKI